MIKKGDLHMDGLAKAYRIAIIGDSVVNTESPISKKIIEKCVDLAHFLSPKKMILFSGGDDGYTRLIMQEFEKLGGITIGIYPGFQEQHHSYSEQGISIPIFTGLGYGMRDILMIRTAEAVISIGGGCGTLNELTNAYYLHKPMYTFTDTGGWSQRIADTYLDNRKKVLLKAYEEPQELVKQLVVDVNKQRRLKKMVSSVIERK